MRCLQRNKVTLYWSQPTGSRTAVVDSDGFATGEYQSAYTTKAKIDIYKTVPDGAVNYFGQLRLSDYDYELIGEGDCPFNENAVLYVNATDTKHKFIIKGIYNSLNSFRVAIKEAKVR